MKQSEIFEEKIVEKSMDEVMHESMIPYSEHIILERALPRAEDGLKPVQRRILYTMKELGLTPDKPHKKSARIVGECLGKFHPHGDSSVYDAMVRLAQPFNMRVPLVDGHGNFGSEDGDSAAAMRYTEARMTSAAMLQLEALDKDTVSMVRNYDDSEVEPELLPASMPNLLINGAMGIAIGVATNIPPHNPGEAIDAVIAQMDDPDISLEDLMKIMPAPDFPTGGLLVDSPEIALGYATGRSKLTMRAKTHFEPQKNGKTLIVATEFPYQVNKAACLQKILDITQEKKTLFAGISDIRDESDRTGIRAVIEVKKDYDAEKILQYLFKYSDLQMTFGVNIMAIADGKPQQLGLKQLIGCYIGHRREVVRRRTEYELEAAQKQEHLFAGLMVAVLNLDEVIATIRASKSPKEAKAALMERFGLTELQAQYILDMRLQRLTNTELQQIKDDYDKIVKEIDRLKGILSSDRKLMNTIKKELLDVREKIADPRRTEIVKDTVKTITASEEKEIVSEDVTVAILEGLRIRRLPRGRFDAAALAEEKPEYIIETNTARRIRIFTDLGAVLTVGVDTIPETRMNAKSANLAGLVPFEKDEHIIAVYDEEDAGEYLFVTQRGMIKRTATAEYKLRVNRTIGMKLSDGDRVLCVVHALDESLPVMMLTRKAMSIRFKLGDVPVQGRVSGGVRGMKVDPDDSVFFMEQCGEEGELAVLTDRGYGKRSFLFDYEPQGRGGKGVRTFEFKKNGSNGTRLAAAFTVKDAADVRVLQRHGSETLLSTEQFRIQERAGKGVMLVAVVLDDDVTAVVPVPRVTADNNE
ncbi:MAG: DNA topoisomerase (ATP-hydrolyzing) [Clostridia bacterium]|nr:DNA topoisomerase (ATP-hydrolyzing) [Clostridia bacterium]